MDQGWAALLGAAIGVVGTTAASALTGWAGRRQVQTQQAGEHARWRKQGQRETYAAFLTTVEQIREHSHRGDVEFARIEQANRASDELNELVDAVNRTLSMVIVEGPESVVRTAEELQETSCEVAGRAMDILSARRNGADVSQLRQDLAEAQSWLDRGITAYAKAVRTVLDQPPST
ncbi:hypothetical protein OIB37_10945 [Streptomyces sp. NBC_00820]|uniref:hypothetical protein n=1 Tax=Streptomyces sp. NBC_00820 TaxID=2975842 RepID=UPI002ED07784|nr:hypothetical protein OIB37_10945 [Streptomyces sp. NBC_00820]